MAGRDATRGYTTRDSIGQPESMRNEEQRLRDNDGGSELTDRPDDHPAGAPGETASAEAEGPPPDRIEPAWPSSTEQPGDDRDAELPIRSAGPPETTLPEESPLHEEDIPPLDDERGE